jgi:hypothetical protein
MSTRSSRSSPRHQGRARTRRRGGRGRGAGPAGRARRPNSSSDRVRCRHDPRRLAAAAAAPCRPIRRAFRSTSGRRSTSTTPWATGSRRRSRRSSSTTSTSRASSGASGFGDDPALAARGITGTGTPGLLNGVIVTESGLVFGAGGDNQIRAWDSDTGRQLWVSRFGGNFVGSPVMYQTGGRQYLLVPAASTGRRSRRSDAGRRGGRPDGLGRLRPAA